MLRAGWSTPRLRERWLMMALISFRTLGHVVAPLSLAVALICCGGRATTSSEGSSGSGGGKNNDASGGGAGGGPGSGGASGAGGSPSNDSGSSRGGSGGIGGSSGTGGSSGAGGTSGAPGCMTEPGTCVLCSGKWTCAGTNPVCPPGVTAGAPCTEGSEGCSICNSDGMGYRMQCAGTFEAIPMPCHP